ncbi:MAG: tetratricopeptide repeat protein, partial [Desulfurobacteriaceae bacterium]
MRFLGMFFVLLLFFCSFSLAQEDNEFRKDEYLFKQGVKQYEIGSYSTALEYFLRLMKPETPYYKKSLLMLSKTYYGIGKKTGEKKYLWQALNYLQLYFIEEDKLPWDFYYMKAKIYESLSFYEQALAVYRVAFLKAENEKQRIATTVGILRTAVAIRRSDLVEEYYILISTAVLTPSQEQEVEFVKGLIFFSKGRYEKALPHFMKVYRKYENYLVDNPEYYYTVAENLYRIGKLTLAEQLFRRIVSLTRGKQVIRRAILRLGDIELKRKNLKLALAYYYSIIWDYPESQEAVVARLKLIPLQEEYPIVKYRLSLSEDSAFKDPIKYIAQVLVNYRTTYVGIYALADLGYLVFKLNALKPIFERLVWEVSLVFPEQVKYEQREFLRSLWTNYLLDLESSKLCELYRSNKRFFQEIFQRDVLLRISFALKDCNQRESRIELLKYIVNKWNSDEDIILMAQALFDNKDFLDALKVLRKVKNKKVCNYEKLRLEVAMFLPIKVRFNEKKLNKLCKKKKKSEEISAIKIFYLTKKGNLDRAFNLFKREKEKIVKSYEKSIVVK